MTKDQLLTRLKDIEWDDFEVKKAQNELPKNIWETVSAFSNSSGGWIVLGVLQVSQGIQASSASQVLQTLQQSKQYRITGVSNAEKLEQDFFSSMRSQKFNAVLTGIRTHKYSIEDKTVLAFFVPSSIHKPIYFNNPKNTFIRCGSGDQRATDSEVSAMFREQSFGIRSELSIPETNINLLKQDSLHGYRNFLVNSNLLIGYKDYDDETFYKKIGVADDKGLLTYAGLLMFGKTEVIHRHIPTFCVDYFEIPGISLREAHTSYTYRIPEQENIWDYYLVLIRRLQLYAETPFKMNEYGASSGDTSQFRILREALVNMLTHTDHFSLIRSNIRVYTNRIEFLNAGSFPIPVERLGTSIISKPRNPTIAKLFRFANLAENAGLGIDKLKSWEQLTGKSFSIQNEIEYVIVTFGLKSGEDILGGEVGLKQDLSRSQAGAKQEPS
jgi:ATP-dependent DNA helicase RecG